MAAQQAPIPHELFRGLEEFNSRKFFECHETLEALWQTQKDPERQFTQGIIQIAVGYYHLLNGNRAGALKLLRRGRERLLPFRPAYCAIDVDALVEAVTVAVLEIEDTPARSPEPPQIRFLFLSS